MGRFVEITIDREGLGAAKALALVRTCPVDIFVLDERGDLCTSPDQEDECVLCGRCVGLAGGALEVRRAYGPRTAVAAAGGDVE